jgi:hypothetical protein
MDHGKVLKRAWHMVWRYRALWIFGIILALTTTSWPAATLYQSRWEENDRTLWRMELPEDMRREIGELVELFTEGIPPDVLSTIVAVGVGLACVIFFLYVAAKVARYVGETALIRMVDDYEERGEALSVRQGLRLGWSRTAWRLFLIDLVIDLPVALALLLLFALAFAPLLLWTSGSEAAGLVGTVTTIGLFFLSIFLLIIVRAVLSLLKRFFRPACALDGLGVTESIRHGYAVVRQYLKDTGLMWLIMAGVDIGWPIVMFPVGLLLAGMGTVLGGFSALLVGGLARLFLSGGTAVLLAVAIGIPIFLLLLIAPLVFLGGLREVFQSSTWTLTYRELRALESLQLDAADAA